MAERDEGRGDPGEAGDALDRWAVRAGEAGGARRQLDSGWGADADAPPPGANPLFRQ